MCGSRQVLAVDQAARRQVVAEEVEFLHNIEWETGKLVRKDLVQRGLLRPSHKDQDVSGAGAADAVSDEATLLDFLTAAIPEDVFPDE